jgi:hypothetical protein
LIIGGYTVGGRSFDAVMFGHYEGPRLLHIERTRKGFTPALQESLMPFSPLDGASGARLGAAGPSASADMLLVSDKYNADSAGWRMDADGRANRAAGIRGRARVRSGVKRQERFGSLPMN